MFDRYRGGGGGGADNSITQMAVMDVSILVLLLGVEQELEWKKVNFDRIRNFLFFQPIPVQPLVVVDYRDGGGGYVDDPSVAG